MKIPETPTNVGAYYGNEENGQWQPNGVIIDSGVGGGIVGSGDAGLHRPVYPLHIPRGHVSGYVMAGPYYGAGVGAGVGAGAAGYQPPPDDFADYMWMEHEEEFDKQVMQQLEEEALMEQCIEAMLEDEQRERSHRPHNQPTTSNGCSLSLEARVSRSTLNPLAAEFVPTRRAPSDTNTQVTSTTEEKTEAPSEASTEHTTEEHRDTEHTNPNTETQPATHTETHTEVTEAQPPAPPEVSASDITAAPISRRDSGNKKKQDKKGKPQTAKSDTKVQAKKKEAKPVKSEGKVSVSETNNIAHSDLSAPSSVSSVPSVPSSVPAAPASAPTVISKTPAPTPAPVPTEEPTGPKPINYAAAARANKPKKPPTTTTITTANVTEKTPPPADKIKTKTDKVEKTASKPAQRKNSAK